MATLPPPPTKAPDGSFAWTDWYNKLQQYVSQGGSVPWNVIDFTGSNLSDIQNRPHNVLQSIQGGTTGEFFHLTATEYANLGNAVPQSRTLTAGAGLTGGGDLSANRTFDVGANADGSIVVNANDLQVGVLATDVQHGMRGGGTQHAVATTSTAGFMSATDKTNLDALSTGTWTNYTPTVTAGAGTFTTITGQAGRYIKIGNTVHLVVRVSITTNGTASNSVIFTLPFTAATVSSPTVTWIGSGREDASAGAMLQARILSGGTVVTVFRYDNTYPGGNGFAICASITYEAA